jgi:hypothetical protein
MGPASNDRRVHLNWDVFLGRHRQHVDEVIKSDSSWVIRPWAIVSGAHLVRIIIYVDLACFDSPHTDNMSGTAPTSVDSRG